MQLIPVVTGREVEFSLVSLLAIQFPISNQIVILTLYIGISWTKRITRVFYYAFHKYRNLIIYLYCSSWSKSAY